jgi:VWFA-related protein
MRLGAPGPSGGKAMKRSQGSSSFRFVGLAVFSFIPAISTAQQPANPAAQQPASPAAQDTSQQPLPVAPVIRKEARLVLVDAVVTDKKGNYVHDLTQNDFKVYEDNKEQAISSFSTGANAGAPQSSQKHYMVLFFDNSSMALPDQLSARAAATKFIDANAAPDHLMAVVEFGGSLQVLQNFTADSNALHAAAQGVKSSYVASNADANAASISVPGMSGISSMEADYGARSMLLAVRTLAKDLRSVPGRKALILFSSGFALTPERQSELTATIDACNKSNVAVYSLDVRGLLATPPGGNPSSQHFSANRRATAVAWHSYSDGSEGTRRARLILASYEPQRPGGGGGGGTGGGAGGGTGGGAGGRGGAGGTGSPGGTGSAGGAGAGGHGGTTGTTGTTGSTGSTGRTSGGSGGGASSNSGYPSMYSNNPMSQPRSIVPQLPPSVATNQQILAALAEGTGGFTIFNTNDFLGGLQRIASEQNEFYLLGYVPPESAEGSCHTLKVKANRGGLNVRARSGYCNARNPSILDGTPVEKQLEQHALESSGGGVHPSFQAPYYYTGPGVARVNLAMEIPQDMFKFDKDKGKYHTSLNVLGIAYRDDGTVGARFSDQVKLDLEKDEWKEFTKTAFKYENQFDAVPGHYKMTVVLSAGSDTYGKSSWPLEIDNYDGKQLALGGIALTNNAQRLDQLAANTDLDSVLLEDRSPLVVKGMQIVPLPVNRFKKTDRVILYSEVYDTLLTGEKPPRIAIAYKIQERATNKEVFFTGSQPADDFLQKGSPVVPIGLMVFVKDLAPGSYRVILMAADSAGRQAPARTVDFEVTE